MVDSETLFLQLVKKLAPLQICIENKCGKKIAKFLNSEVKLSIILTAEYVAWGNSIWESWLIPSLLLLTYAEN